MASEPKTTILLADDHPLIQDGIRLLLSDSDHLEIVHAVSNGVEALDYLAQNQVDLLLTDISMPSMDGIELTKSVKTKYPEMAVIILSMHDDAASVSNAIFAEADGYVLKNTGRTELEAAINKVIDGGTFYSSGIVQVIMKGVVHEHKKAINTKPLSEREIEILKLVCDELTTTDIADRLFISPRTVETHRKNIIRKTGVKSIVGLIKFAIVNKLIAVEPQ